MAKELEATRLAMNAASEAKPSERRQRMLDLYAAGVKLRDLTVRYHDWLVTEDAWLTANQATDQAFLERETRYLTRVVAYQEAMDVLSAAYEMVRDASRSPSMPKPKKEVWRQLGEAPFILSGLTVLGALLQGVSG